MWFVDELMTEAIVLINPRDSSDTLPPKGSKHDVIFMIEGVELTEYVSAYTFDPDAGAIYFRLGHGRVKKTIEVVLKALFDIDEEGRVVGIEVLPTNSEILEGMRRIIQATSL